MPTGSRSELSEVGSSSQASEPKAIGGTGDWAYLLSIGVAVLAFVVSLAGLLIDGVYGEPVSVAEMLRGYDLVTVGVVVPVLVISQPLARRGSTRAQLVWTGLLAYLVYTYAYYLFPTSFNGLLLLHVVVFSASLLALILTVLALDVAGIADRFNPHTPRRVVSCIMAVLGLALGGLWVYHSVQFITTGALPAGSSLVEPDVVVHLGVALDLAFLVPAYALAAVWLWRGFPVGYVLAAVVLVSGTLHQLSYMVALLFQAAAGLPDAVAFDPVEPVIALLYLVASALLLWGAGSQRRESSTEQIAHESSALPATTSQASRFIWRRNPQVNPGNGKAPGTYSPMLPPASTPPRSPIGSRSRDWPDSD
jgi:hypothetical protein